MGSNDREVQLAQLERAKEELSARMATLAAKSVDEKTVARDTVVRRLQADIKKLKKRLATIDALEKKQQTLAERKAAKLAAPKEKKKKGKKAEELAQQQQGKGKKKKKK